MKIKLRILLLFILLLSLCDITYAEKPQKFNPAQFQRDLEQFITEEALLTPSEASVFFPVYREMRNRLWTYICEDRRLCFVDTSNDKACAEAIKRRDAIDIEMKTIQQQYHLRFMALLPASKVFKILRAEDKFHRRLFKTGERNKKNVVVRKCVKKIADKKNVSK